jgi:hypothetical protein
MAKRTEITTAETKPTAVQATEPADVIDVLKLERIVTNFVKGGGNREELSLADSDALGEMIALVGGELQKVTTYDRRFNGRESKAAAQLITDVRKFVHIHGQTETRTVAGEQLKVPALKVAELRQHLVEMGEAIARQAAAYVATRRESIAQRAAKDWESDCVLEAGRKIPVLAEAIALLEAGTEVYEANRSWGIAATICESAYRALQCAVELPGIKEQIPAGTNGHTLHETIIRQVRARTALTRTAA